MDPRIARLTTAQESPQAIPERRDPQSRERLRLQVRSQFDEGALVLTPAAAARLFGIREDVCMRVLRELEVEGLLYSSGKRYATRFD